MQWSIVHFKPMHITFYETMVITIKVHKMLYFRVPFNEYFTNNKGFKMFISFCGLKTYIIRIF